MKKQAWFCALLLAVSLAAVSQSFAGRQDFTIVNNTGAAIYYFYVSASNVDDWEEDVLGEDVLLNGYSKKIQFSSYESRRYWDIKIVDGAGNEFVWKRINLLSTSTITLYVSQGRVMANFQ